MDLETENRLAAMLVEEARRLRLQADKEGVHAYLKPNVRSRPNSRFLTATVLGVQQANRVVEVSEMWRARDKELELDCRRRDRSKASSRSRSEKRQSGCVEGRLTSGHEGNDTVSAALCSSKRAHDDGMQDEEIEKFLHSRQKRGRGAIGSRMDEPGPYLSTSCTADERLFCSPDVREKEEWEKRIVGPEKASFMRSPDHLSDSHNTADHDDDSRLSKKHHSKKHSSKKDKPKKKKRKERRSKHHHKNH